MYDRSFAYNEGSQLCGTGGDWNEVRENVDLTIVHNSASATVVFTSTLDEDANNVPAYHSLIRNLGVSVISKYWWNVAQPLAIRVAAAMPHNAHFGN